eukprot:XP_016661873.1 PREDICTED: uncharacterized protein LOC107884404 [Acyrthosiphon pisum]
MVSGIQVYNAPVYHSRQKNQKVTLPAESGSVTQKKEKEKRCFRCRKTGHFVRDCPDPHTPQRPPNTANTQTDVTIEDVTKKISMVTVESVNSQDEQVKSDANRKFQLDNIL